MSVVRSLLYFIIIAPLVFAEITITRLLLRLKLSSYHRFKCEMEKEREF